MLPNDPSTFCNLELLEADEAQGRGAPSSVPRGRERVEQ